MIQSGGDFMIRKMLSIIVAMAISTICLICGTVSAAYIPPDSPQYNYTQSCSSELSISGSTATCRSVATGYINQTTKIVFVQTLQKRNSSGGWDDVATWTTTINNYQGTVTKTKSGLSSGTYRLKTVFIVYAGSSYEVITKYSQEWTI